MPTNARSARRGKVGGDRVHRETLSRIAVGVDGYPAGRDAVVLGEVIGSTTGAEVMLVAVHTDPLVVLPSGMDWKSLEAQAEQTVREARDALAPGARVCVETDLFVIRALERVVRREHRDLLVVGSSRHATEGRVRMGNRTRQLLDHGCCPVAIASRGMHREPRRELARIGVGYDGGSESQAALELAATIAVASGAELHVHGVVDDRTRSLGRRGMGTGAVIVPSIGWQPTGSKGATVEATKNALRIKLEDAARATGAKVVTDVRQGRPASLLLELSEQVDLLVIGSRRWGAAARLILGSTGEAVLHDAGCATLVVARPQE